MFPPTSTVEGIFIAASSDKASIAALPLLFNFGVAFKLLTASVIDSDAFVIDVAKSFNGLPLTRCCCRLILLNSVSDDVTVGRLVISAPETACAKALSPGAKAVRP